MADVQVTCITKPHPQITWGILAKERNLKTVELRHADIAQNDSDVLLEKLLERLSRGPGFDQVFSEALQYRLVAEELRRLIVDKQNVNPWS